jgi:hypothetical protein
MPRSKNDFLIFKIWKIITLPLISCGCNTSSLILRDGCGLEVFEITVLRRLIGLNRDTEIGG